jgi:hypothetical protein
MHALPSGFGSFGFLGVIDEMPRTVAWEMFGPLSLDGGKPASCGEGIASAYRRTCVLNLADR